MSMSSNKKNVNNLPDGWEVRIDKNTGRVYFLNHEHKTTTWTDPRPLPSGYEMKKNNKGQIYFVNHHEKTTQWNDPRPDIIIPSIKLQRYNQTITNSTESVQRQRKDSKGHVRGHSLDIEWYSDILRMALIDRTLTVEEEAYLSKMRDKLDITELEHKETLIEIGWSDREIMEAKQDSLKNKECVVCLAAPATYIVQDCMHICLCADCSLHYNGIHKDKGCPICKGKIKNVKKTY